MSLLYIEGFEGMGTVLTTDIDAELVRKWPNSSLTATFSKLRAGRTGGFAWGVTQLADFVESVDFGAQATMVVGFGFKPGSLPADVDFMLLPGGISLATDTNGAIRLKRGASLLASSAPSVLSIGSFAYIEVKAFTDNATGTAEVRVDGTQVINFGPGDTLDTGVPSRLRLLGINNANEDVFDDIYILNTSGAKNNDFLGRQKVVPMLPDAAGDSTQWTPDSGSNFQRVDENPPDQDTSFVEAGTVGFKDLYNFSNPAGIVGAVAGVQLNSEAKVTSGTLNFTHVFKSGATEQDQATKVLSGLIYANEFNVVEDDPNTASPWTESALNALQLGYKVG